MVQTNAHVQAAVAMVQVGNIIRFQWLSGLTSTWLGGVLVIYTPRDAFDLYGCHGTIVGFILLILHVQFEMPTAC